jgi:hypothetical protein
VKKKLASFLVGFRGGERSPWSGGAFRYEAADATAAARLGLAEHGDHFPGGRKNIAYDTRQEARARARHVRP